MTDLRTIETTALLDMLAAQTSEYLRLSSESGREAALGKCFLSLRAIQEELEYRQGKSGNREFPGSELYQMTG